jgi:hypothetical protein
MSDYYNLLEDTLRSSYFQIEKIHKRVKQASKENKYVNIRTGYPMKFRKYNSNYMYSETKFPLCYNSGDVGANFHPNVISRLLNSYQKWLADYDIHEDNETIRKMVEDEKAKAKSESQNENININKAKPKIMKFAEPPYGSHLIFDDDRENSVGTVLNSENEKSFDNISDICKDSFDSFIVPDDYEEELVINKKNMKFKFSLGKRGQNRNKNNEANENENREIIKLDEEEYEDINKIYIEEKDCYKFNLKKKKKRLCKNGHTIDKTNILI